MRLHITVTTLLCLSLCVLACGEDSHPGGNARSDQQLLQGTWKMVRLMKNGVDEDVVKHPATLTITAKDITETRSGNSIQTGTYALDPSANPKRITMVATTGDNAGKTFEGIYEVDGTTLKLAYSFGDHAATPPKDFSGGEGTGLLVLERERS